MVWRLSILALVALALAGCGGGGGSEETTTTTTTSTTTAAVETTTSNEKPAAIAFRTYFFKGGALVPVTALVPPTQAIARASLEHLLQGAPAGYRTAIPGGVKLEGVAIANGIATASFSGQLGDLPRTAQGQIVSTLAQFPSVRAVRIEVNGKPASLQDGSGEGLTRPAVGTDYQDLTPDALIFVRTPLRDATVTSPVEAAGTASVFEATLQVQVWSGGNLVSTKTITASEGAPGRGDWSARLALPKGDVRLLFFEPSAEDGSHLHETEVLLHVK